MSRKCRIATYATAPHGNADVSPACPRGLGWVQTSPSGLSTRRLNATSVTGATNTQRWPLIAQPSSTLTRISALSRSKR